MLLQQSLIDFNVIVCFKYLGVLPEMWPLRTHPGHLYTRRRPLRGVRPHEGSPGTTEARLRCLRSSQESNSQVERLHQKKMIKFLQINLQRSDTAQSLLQQTSAERGAQVLIVSELNWLPANDDRWVSSNDGTSAVALTTAADFVSETNGSGRGFAWI